MRILYLAHRVPYPPDKGDKIRSFHTLKQLSQHHTVHLVCLAWSVQESDRAAQLEKYCESIDVVIMRPAWSKLKSFCQLFSTMPLTLSYFSSTLLHRTLRNRILKQQIDAIIVFSSSMAQYVPISDSRIKIMDFTDVDSDKWLQYSKYAKFPWSLLYRLESRRLRRYEISLAPWYDVCTVISRAEERLFRSYSDQFVLKTVPNGVDLDYFRAESRHPDKNTLIFVGAMDYYANREGVIYFHDAILPRIREKIPDVKFIVVGGPPGRAIQDLAGENSVTLTGYVPDVRSWMARATVCVVPLHIARGVQNKVLEAMAMGLPVIATSRAVEGIDALPGKHYFVADDSQEFADRTVELLGDRQLQASISQEARKLVEEKYQWRRCLSQLDHILEDLRRKHSSPSSICAGR